MGRFPGSPGRDLVALSDLIFHRNVYVGEGGAAGCHELPEGVATDWLPVENNRRRENVVDRLQLLLGPDFLEEASSDRLVLLFRCHDDLPSLAVQRTR